MQEKDQEYGDFIIAALESSIYVAPLMDGLTLEELLDAGAPLGLKRGLMVDTVNRLRQTQRIENAGTRLRLCGEHHMVTNFIMGRFAPELRPVDEMNYVIQHLRKIEEDQGRAEAHDTRENIVTAALNSGEAVTELGIDVAIRLLLMAERLEKTETGELRVPNDKRGFPLPSTQLNSVRNGEIYARPLMGKVHPLVQRAIAARGTRPQADAGAAAPARPPPVPSSELQRMFDARSFHAQVVEHSRKLFVDGHNRPAIVDACLALQAEVQKRTGRVEDGDDLMNIVFNANTPLLLYGTVGTVATSEQRGLMYALKAVVALLRNPNSHALLRHDEVYTLECLSFVSLAFRWLEQAKNP